MSNDEGMTKLEVLNPKLCGSRLFTIRVRASFVIRHSSMRISALVTVPRFADGLLGHLSRTAAGARAAVR